MTATAWDVDISVPDRVKKESPGGRGSLKSKPLPLARAREAPDGRLVRARMSDMVDSGISELRHLSSGSIGSGLLPAS
ncbi:hypothetical protein [Streptomyces sp. NPDC001153]